MEEKTPLQNIAELHRLVRLYKESLDKLIEQEALDKSIVRLKVYWWPKVGRVRLSNQIIMILHLRDEIEQIKELPENRKFNDLYHNIITQDIRLKRHSKLVATSLNFIKIRGLIKPPVERWWWHPVHPLNKLDPFFSSLSIIFLIGALAIAIDLVPRFFAGGADLWGGLIILITPLVSWFFGKEALDGAPKSKALLERAIIALGVSLQWRQEVVFLLSALFLTTLCILSDLREKISDNYYCRAFNQAEMELNSKNCNLKIIANSDPEANLKVAIALNPSNADALFQLGWLYERRQDLKLAQEKYKVAADTGHLLASQRLAILQILENSDKSVDLASATLWAGREKAWRSPQSTDDVKQSWHVTLAWVRYLQGREREVQEEIRFAKNLTPHNKKESKVAFCVGTALQQSKYDKDRIGARENNVITKRSLIQKWESCSNQPSTLRERDFWKGQSVRCIQSINSDEVCLLRDKSKGGGKPDIMKEQ
jgi:tetratricopeptide (TPR) repeat protein